LAAEFHDELAGTETVAQCAMRLLDRYREAREFVKDVLPTQYPKILGL